MTMMMISMITVRILVAGNSYNEIAENATYRPQHFNATNQIELHLLTYLLTVELPSVWMSLYIL